MKYTYAHQLDIPLKEKQFILPQPRIDLFKNLIDNYKVFCPELKLIYAYLNFNSKHPIDYLLIFTATSKGNKVLLWDAPYLYSNKTIPAYRYVCKNNLYDQFFKYCEESLCRISYSKFLEFIPCNLCGLSLNPKNPKYWADQNNADILLGAMSELSLQYTPQPGDSKVIAVKYTKEEMLGKNN